MDLGSDLDLDPPLLDGTPDGTPDTEFLEGCLKSRAKLEREGYTVIPMCHPHYTWVGYNFQTLLFVLVVAREPTHKQIEYLADMVLPSNCRKVIHHWPKNQGSVEITEVH